jgi:MYXO-CTERM domain-containing protein
MRAFLCVFALGSVLATTTAHAYTTRVHISLANDIREDLIANGDGTLRLRWSDFAVTLPPEDVDAIINQPLAFRAGAVGPDNMVFPGMTDATHAVDQNPYRQCQLLYEDAITETERAYALGCFLHGSSDAIAHHFVNYFTGETFTLNPISVGRSSSWSNVVGHVTTEGLIQDAFLAADPSRFSMGALQHDIPRSFVLRNYFQEDAPLWQLMSRHARARLDAARAADPSRTLPAAVAAAGLAPYEYLVLAPVFVRETDASRADLRSWVEGEIADMQDPTSARGSSLLVGPGPDGMLGTRDDDTACTTSCAASYAQYTTYIRLLEPRRDAGGRELPSAFDKIVDELGQDLAGLLPALLEVVENLSAALNSELLPGTSGLDFDRIAIEGYFLPLQTWLDDTTTIDWTTVVNAVAPEWLVDLDRFLDSLGVPWDLATLLDTIFAPVLDGIRETVRDYVIGTARTYVNDLTAEYRATYATWQSDERAALAAAAPAGLTGDTLDYVEDSGLWAYSFNVVAVTLADHRVMLVDGDPITDGPTSFDASYTPRWSQLGLCDYLGRAVFPEGFDVRALLSVHDGATLHPSSVGVDSPVECHDGDLTRFGTPSETSCAHTDLAALAGTPVGSVSRAFPPDYSAGMPRCVGLAIPGLPDPPVGTDGGVPGGDGGPGADGGDGPPGAGGCGCSVPAHRGDTPLFWPLLVLLVLARRRARRLSGRGAGRWALLALAVTLVGCPDPSTDSDVPGGSDTPGGADAPDEDAGGGDTGTRMDTGPDPRRVLMEALGTSTWSARQTRFEPSGGGGGMVERAYELQFRASSLEWAEIRNPFGPARRRRLRVFTIERDGTTVNSTVMNPDTWPVDPMDGTMESWLFTVTPGTPRTLTIESVETGAIEVFQEEAWPAPTGGLTAEVRVFGPDGAMGSAACGNSTTFDRPTIMAFARGASVEMPIERDVMAGAPIESWSASTAFGVTDVAGFDQLGGTLVTDQSNFVVRYTGTVAAPSGTIRMREADDVVDGGLFVFAGANVGSTSISDLFLEAQFFTFIPDATDDEVSGTFAPGDVDFEAILWRCAGGDATDLQIDVGAGYGPVSTAITSPIIDAALFPPAF